MDSIEMVPIGLVHGGRDDVVDDDWGSVLSTVSLDPDRFGPDAVAGLEDFSHVEIVFVFDRVDETSVNVGARRPRGRQDWPMVGIFAQRAKARPNRIGVTTCELVSVDGLDIGVRGLDAIDGTPVLDIKPHVVEFGPRTEVRQPDWISELMTGYW
ncbi:MAG: SAM-dependent methyltransferase [Acidimicrobiia bacterium]|nr:SAM-dependent methyltransferase [Acidimicrobiia bacterium]